MRNKLSAKDMILKLRSEREKQKITQLEMAKMIGITNVQLCRIENNKSGKLTTLQKYAVALGYSISFNLEKSHDHSI